MKKFVCYAISLVLIACVVAAGDYFFFDQNHGSFLYTCLYYLIMFTVVEIVVNWMKKMMK